MKLSYHHPWVQAGQDEPLLQNRLRWFFANLSGKRLVWDDEKFNRPGLQIPTWDGVLSRANKVGWPIMQYGNDNED